LKCIASIRNRYDGMKRSPFDEAECGHHYGRAMISWAGLLALTGFHYSAVNQEMIFAPKDGNYFWSTGYAYGTITQKGRGTKRLITITAIKGNVRYKTFTLRGFGKVAFDVPQQIEDGQRISFEVSSR